MSTGRKTTIGFDRTIHIEWLDIAAARVSRGELPAETRKVLWDFLEDLVPGNTNNSGRGKTLTVLTRIWLTVPEQVEPLRDRALECLAAANGQNRVAVHWAMVMATHPFFFDVATHVGKLLTLHGQANRSQIKRRMTESWGDRSTLERTIQHVLKSMAQWGVLKPGSEKGSLVVARNPVQVSEEIAELLVHGVMLSQGRGMSLSQLISHPAIFPFKLQLSAAKLRKHPCLRVQRQGDQSDFVELGYASSPRRKVGGGNLYIGFDRCAGQNGNSVLSMASANSERHSCASYGKSDRAGTPSFHLGGRAMALPGCLPDADEWYAMQPAIAHQTGGHLHGS